MGPPLKTKNREPTDAGDGNGEEREIGGELSGRVKGEKSWGRKEALPNAVFSLGEHRGFSGAPSASRPFAFVLPRTGSALSFSSPSRASVSLSVPSFEGFRFPSNQPAALALGSSEEQSGPGELTLCTRKIASCKYSAFSGGNIDETLYG